MDVCKVCKKCDDHCTGKEPSMLVGATKSDMVNHPPHYNQHPKGIECIDVIEECGNFNLGQVMRYVWRVAFGGKANNLEDLEKAQWYLDRAIKRERLS